MRHVKAIVAATLLALAGCDQKPKLECTSASAQSTAIDLIKENIRLAVMKTLADADRSTPVPGAKVRAIIQQLSISLNDIRTSREDPNSTKKFCTANVHIQVPEDIVRSAEEVRAAASSPAMADVADRDNVDQQYNVIKLSLDFDVQPTDDGSKVYAESDDLAHLKDFFSELIGSALLKPVLDNARAAQQQTVAAQQAAETAERNANLVQAKTDDQLANQVITAVWRSIDPEKRSALLPEQRAWIQKKTADCDLESASATTDPTDKESAKYKCDARVTQERIAVLKQYAPVDGPPTNLLPAENR